MVSRIQLNISIEEFSIFIRIMHFDVLQCTTLCLRHNEIRHTSAAITMMHFIWNWIENSISLVSAINLTQRYTSHHRTLWCRELWMPFPNRNMSCSCRTKTCSWWQKRYQLRRRGSWFELNFKGYYRKIPFHGTGGIMHYLYGSTSDMIMCGTGPTVRLCMNCMTKSVIIGI